MFTTLIRVDCCFPLMQLFELEQFVLLWSAIFFQFSKLVQMCFITFAECRVRISNQDEKSRVFVYECGLAMVKPGF